jgi:2-succinyl-5-enolpyruvyl-6-hydroxy-3-cyclohexene-1-carboxylate synthase
MNPSTAFARVLVDELVRGGVTDAVLSPGSRSAALAYALHDADAAGRLRLHVRIDERSAGYLALGLAKASGRPVPVVTTSGTAVANLHPAAVEAAHTGVPLLLLTADRPPELRGVGANQTIEQPGLFAPAAGTVEVGTPERRAGQNGYWRSVVSRALATGGPVHLNLPFREPLVGSPGRLPPARDGGWARLSSPTGANRREGRQTALPPRTLVVAGAVPGLDGELVHAVAAARGWPVVAEPRSAAWRPAGTTVAHLDAILRSPVAAGRLRPDAVLRLGAPGSSRVVNEWLAASGATEVVAGAAGWSDPAGTAALVVEGDPAHVLRAAVEGEPERGWLAGWQAAAAAADKALAAELDALAGPNEPGVARAVAAALPDGAHLVVSSSMPVRDVERYAAPRTGLTVVANRGANGIDGVVSTAVGVAAGSGTPTVLLIGDVAFLHDSNGLLGARGRGVDLTCVVVDNDGGGIFSFLPQATALAPDRFEDLFGTPHGLDLVALAAAYGVEARGLGDGEDAGAAAAAAVSAGGIRVLVVRTDRAANVAAHRRLDGAVASAVTAALED